jgi:flagellar basal body-associated protein FliL
VSSRTARATQRNPVSKKKTNNNKIIIIIIIIVVIIFSYYIFRSLWLYELEKSQN